MGIQSGDEVIMEVRGRELLIKPELDPEKFVEDFYSAGGRKLAQEINLEELIEEEVGGRLALRRL